VVDVCDDAKITGIFLAHGYIQTDRKSTPQDGFSVKQTVFRRGLR
jgi:hypothetical protein